MVNLLNMDSILEIKNNFLMEYEQQQELDIENIQSDFIKESNTRQISQKTLRKIKNYPKSKNIPINFEKEVQDNIKNNYLSKITPPLSKTPESGVRSFTDSNETPESGVQLPENSLTVSDFLSNKPKIISIKQIENYLNKKISGRIKPISSNPRYLIPSNKTKKDIKNALLFSSIIDPKSSHEIFKIQKKIQQIPAYSEGGLISYSQSGETNLGLVGEIQPEQISSTPHGIEVNPTVNNKVNSLGMISDPSVVIASQKGIETPEYSSVKTKDFNTQQIKLGDGGFIPQNEKINLIEDLKKIFLEIPPIESAEMPPNLDTSYTKNEPFPIEFTNIRNINSMISDLFASRAFRRI